MRKDVLNFIELFSNSKEIYLNGLCYWFSYLLCGRFPCSEVWYDPIMNHFATLIDGTLYDAGGVVWDSNFVPWDAYKNEDELHTSRIVRDCMNIPKEGAYGN